MKAFNQEAKTHFEKYGYVILENMIPETEVQILRDTVYKLAKWEKEQGEGAVYGDGKHQRIWNLLNKHQIFRDLIQLPTIIDAMKYSMGDKIMISSWTANIVGAGGNQEGLHIDANVPDPIPAFPVKVNSIWMLDDFTEDNGATLVLPGSHKWLRHPKAEDQQNGTLIKLTAPKGSIALMNGALWHRSGINRTDKDRSGLLGSFCPEFMRPQEDHLQIMNDKVIEGMSPLLQQLIGHQYGINQGAKLYPPKHIF